MPASCTDAKRAVADPRQRLLDRAQEPTVGLMQPDVQLRISVGIGLIDEVPLRIPGSGYPHFSPNPGAGQLLPLGKQQPLVSLEVPCVHSRSTKAANLALCMAFYIHENTVSAPLSHTPQSRPPRPLFIARDCRTLDFLDENAQGVGSV